MPGRWCCVFPMFVHYLWLYFNEFVVRSFFFWWKFYCSWYRHTYGVWNTEALQQCLISLSNFQMPHSSFCPLLEMLNFTRIHQIQLTLSATLLFISAAYSIITSKYYFSSLEATKASISRIATHLFLLVVSVALLAASAFGSRVPHVWFSLLDSYKGTGFFMIYLGFFVLNISDELGLVTAIIAISTGVASIVYSIMNPDANKKTDKTLLG